MHRDTPLNSECGSEFPRFPDESVQPVSLEILQTRHAQMREVLEKVRLVAPTKATVLLDGETGTGKGVLANLIHRNSNRKGMNFVSVHCGAIPDTLIESELFGHEKGAFTDAVNKKLGKFEIAHRGTIFLDEIGTLTPGAQIKLLQVLQDNIFQRVGGEKTIEVDVRIIAATNNNLKDMCDKGQFRRDLYYRLNVFPIHIPALKERVLDIPYFVDFFLKNLSRAQHKNIKGIDPLVMESFRQYAWPGNIRELENLLERAVILTHGPILGPENFPEEIVDSKPAPERVSVNSSLTLAQVRSMAVNIAEKTYISELLSKNRGRIKESAEAAGITPRQFHKLMTKHNVDKKIFKMG